MATPALTLLVLCALVGLYLWFAGATGDDTDDLFDDREEDEPRD
jgi:hypothetical protein